MSLLIYTFRKICYVPEHLHVLYSSTEARIKCHQQKHKLFTLAHALKSKCLFNCLCLSNVQLFMFISGTDEHAFRSQITSHTKSQPLLIGCYVITFSFIHSLPLIIVRVVSIPAGIIQTQLTKSSTRIRIQTQTSQIINHDNL